MTKSKQAILLLVAPILLLLLWLGAEWAAARWLSGSCGRACSLKVSSVSVRPGHVVVRGFALRAGREEEERWEISARVLTLRPHWAALARGKWAFEELSAGGLKVELHEGEAKKPRAERKELPAFSVGRVRVSDGAFRYLRHKAGQRGTIELTEIVLNGGPIGTADGLDENLSRFDAEARLEGSGRVRLTVNARFFQADPALRLRLELSGQDLAGVNRYFEPMDQLKLKGRLVRSEAVLSSDGASLRATVDVRYRGLDVQFLGGRERSKFSAFLGNLLKGLGIDEENLDEERSLTRGQVSLRREPGESIVSFVLRGLKEAAMKVAAT